MCDKTGIYSLRRNPYGGKLSMGKDYENVFVCVCVCISILFIQSHIICLLVMLYVKSCMQVKICMCVCEDN